MTRKPTLEQRVHFLEQVLAPYLVTQQETLNKIVAVQLELKDSDDNIIRLLEMLDDHLDEIQADLQRQSANGKGQP